MPRMEANLGEIAHPPVGGMRSPYGSFGVRENPQRMESRHAGCVPSQRPKPPKQPLCKTCNDRVCVGNCRY
jgi:hypothetical protein